MNTLKSILKQTIGRIFQHLFVLPNNKMKIILMYHRVADELPKVKHDPHLFVKSDTFEMHINEISKYFTIVTLDEMLNNAQNNKRLCVLTFDDGWLDNYETAYPIIQKSNVPATIFLPINDIGTTQRFWFDHLFFLANSLSSTEDQNAYISHFQTIIPAWNSKELSTASILELTEKLKSFDPQLLYDIIDTAYTKLEIELPFEKVLMNWKQVQEMGQNGISFGSHGLNHDILPTLSNQSKKNIVFESLSILKDKTVTSIPFFSYPNGNWDHETVDFLKRAGYHGAVTTENGFCNGTNPFLLNRIGLSEASSNTSDLFWFQIGKAFLSS